jgi:hypothetical protein
MLEARCRHDADHCERMAAIMLTKAQRDSYLELAQAWRKLANEAGNHRQRVEAWTRKTAARPAAAATFGDAGAGGGVEPRFGAD